LRETGMAQPHFNIGAMRVKPFPLPPLAEQHEIVRRVEALFALADKIESRVALATQRVEKTTQAILAKAFRGELVPTEAELARQQNRNYEPATALLERIRAEREATGAAPPKGPRRRTQRT
jgi:type I restriction enzyme S subunit